MFFLLWLPALEKQLALLLAARLIADTSFEPSGFFSSFVDFKAVFMTMAWSKVNLLIECRETEGFSDIFIETFSRDFAELRGVGSRDLHYVFYRIFKK